MTIGVYCIKNKVDGLVYVGQSVNVRSRLNDHKSDLRRGIHENPHLQNAFNKYGLGVFEFSVLCECSEMDLDAQERYWIETFKSSDKRHGYNLKTGGQAHNKFSGDAKVRMANSARNRKVFGRVGYKGVGWRESVGKYVAKITVNKKDIFLGYFATAEEAASAYDVAAIEYLGDGASLNFKKDERRFSLVDLFSPKKTGRPRKAIP